MAITSIGYPNTVGATNIDWANAQLGLGRGYWTQAGSAVQVTPKSDGTRQVNIGAGWFGAHGVVDHNLSTATVTLPTVASGTRWFMIVARRNWNPGSIGTTFTYIDGGTSNSTLPSRNTDGTVSGGSGLDDQPLALVPLTAGDTVPGAPIDLRARCYLGDIYHAADERTLQYMAAYGRVIKVGNTTWTYGPGGWQPDSKFVRSGPGLGNELGVSSAGGGWVTVSELNQKLSMDGRYRQLFLQARKAKGGDHVVFSPGSGHVNNTAVLSVDNADAKPPTDLSAVAFEYKANDGGVYGGVARYTAAGNFIIISGAPGTEISYRESDLGSWTIKCTQLSWVDER